MSTTDTATPTLEAALRDLMPALLGYFVRRLENRDDAADAVAETLLVLWRRESHIPSDDEGRRRYAFGIARNVLSTMRRGRMRRHALAERLRSELLETRPIADAVDPDLRDALRRLTDRDRELVLLVAWDGFGVAEAGAVLGLKPEAARQRYGRARTRLRALLVSPGDREQSGSQQQPNV